MLRYNTEDCSELCTCKPSLQNRQTSVYKTGIVYGVSAIVHNEDHPNVKHFQIRHSETA